MTGRLAELARRFQDIIDHLTDKPFTWGQGDGTLSDQTDLQTALDGKADIEEGSWTPVYTATGGGSTNHNEQIGGYVRLGMVVYVWLRISAERGTLSGNIRIAGLEHESADFGDNGLAIGRARRFQTDMPNLRARVVGNEIRLEKSSTNELTEIEMQDSDLVSGNTNRNNLRISGFYFIDD